MQKEISPIEVNKKIGRVLDIGYGMKYVGATLVGAGFAAVGLEASGDARLLDLVVISTIIVLGRGMYRVGKDRLQKLEWLEAGRVDRRQVRVKKP